jgi:hypothetical protein
MREAVTAAGGEGDAIQVAGTLPAVRRDDRGIDLDATMERIGPLVDAGVTDFRAYLPVPSAHDAAVDYLGEVLRTFRAATG